MSDTDATIHDFDFNLICEYYANLERQGPGSPEMTLKALSFIGNLTDTSQIADLGCGTGGQTMVLARHAPGKITGLDLYPGFIDLFNANAKRLNLDNRVTGVVGSMDALPFAPASLDLIWAEGSIYNIGFQRGLTEWREFLKPGGYIAVSEASWFTPQRPAEIETFWMESYPEIDTIPNKVAQMQDAGYIPVASFILPETCWTDHFYNSHPAVQDAFLKKYKGDKTVEAFIASERRGAKLYEAYKDCHGYAFYIGKSAARLCRD